jgi:hypothetical protein
MENLTGNNRRKGVKYRLKSLAKCERFCNLGVRDKLISGNVYFSTSSLQLSNKNKAGAFRFSDHGLSRKLPCAPACYLLTSKKFAK